MVSEAHKLGYEDYLAMPNDGHRYEIINGELFVSAAPSLRHQAVLRNLALFLVQHVRAHGLGTVLFAPCAVRLTPNEPVEPDLLFVRRERSQILGENAVEGVPDLIVEIVSPSNPHYDRVTKLNRYSQVGVREYWIIDPIGESVDQYVLAEGRYVPLERKKPGVLGSHVVDGLQLETAGVFAD